MNGTIGINGMFALIAHLQRITQANVRSEEIQLAI